MRSFKLRHRCLTAVAVAAAVIASTAGCSTPTADDQEDVDLSLMIWDPAQTAGVQKAVDGFEAANPNIHVSLQQVPQDQYYTKLDASLGAGEGPDVMWQSSKAFEYVDGGALEPLDEYIERDGVDLDGYPEKLVNLYNFDGQQYGMPKDQDAWTFVYNSAVFEALGVDDLPMADWTWDDMVRIAKEVKEKQTSATDVPLFYDHQFNNGVSSVVHQLGGEIIADGAGAVSSPEGEEALEMIKGLQDEGLIPPIADSADFDPVKSLISGTLAMSVIPSWNLSLLSRSDAPEGTFHVVRLPSVSGSWATDTNGLSYVMNANSQHKEEAWELIEFLTSDQGAALHAAGGASPPANKADEAQQAFVETNKALDGLADALAATYDQAYLRTSTAFPLFRASIPEVESTVMGPYYAGQLSAADAAAQVDAIINKALG